MNLFFFFLGIFIMGCSHQTKNAEYKEREMVLKYHIKKITEYQTVLNPVGIFQKELIRREKTYNKYGFKIKETVYHNDGTLEYVISLQYDKNGNLIFRKAVNPDSTLSFSDKGIYDENNNKTDYYFYNPDGSVLYRKPAVFDEEDRMIENRVFHDGELKAVSKFIYQDSKMIENNEYDSAGNFRHKWLYQYDVNSNLIEEMQLKSKNIETYKNTYQYNEWNQLTKETRHSGGGFQNTFIYEYYLNRLLSAKSEYSTGRFISKLRYQYEFF